MMSFQVFDKEKKDGGHSFGNNFLVTIHINSELHRLYNVCPTKRVMHSSLRPKETEKWRKFR